MHEFPDALVSTNVRLPAISNPTRTREIDVLITGQLAGYSIRLALECKNWKETVDVPVIDAFIGKLDDVGIPRQHGIFVTTRSFTSGARDRAATAGIRAFTLEGLSDDRLTAEIAKAFMSLVYLLPIVNTFKVVNSMPSIKDPTSIYTLYDASGADAGTIVDLVWWQWRDGAIPSLIGRHKIAIPLPDGWHMRYDGRMEVPLFIGAEIDVVGLVLVAQGTAANFRLRDTATGQIAKSRLETTFGKGEAGQPLIVVNSEAELQSLLAKKDKEIMISLGRVRLPRIRSGPFYWPLSERVRQQMDQMLRDRDEEKLKQFFAMGFDEIEGSNLESAFEPIWRVPRSPRAV